MKIVNVSNLKPHPRNNEFFDNITGENWESFLESILENGVIEPIIITKENVIVSGHQRLRACIKLNISEVPVIIREYNPNEEIGLTIEDAVLEELILTNLRQRGNGNPNLAKLGYCIEELKRIKDVKIKGKGYSMDDLSKELGISRSAMSRYIKLTQTIPEIQEMMNSGKITYNIGERIFARMSEEDQEKMLDLIGRDRIEKMNMKEIKNHIEIAKDNEKSNVETIKEIIKVVPPEDYTEIKLYVDEAKQIIKTKEKELHDATVKIQKMKATDEGIAKAETERRKIESEVIKNRRKLNEISQMYVDATSIFKKQKKLEETLEDLKEIVIRLESEFGGYVPDDYGRNRYINTMNEVEKMISRSLGFLRNNCKVIGVGDEIVS